MRDSCPLVNIVTREFKADPFPFYARLRKEQPVCRVRLGRRQEVWLNALLRGFPSLRLAIPAEKLRWRTTPILRGLEALPVEF